jgi:microcystin degradation protein MlrC
LKARSDKVRIVTGTISHETNTFSNIPTNLDEFGKQTITLGDDIPKRFEGTSSIEAAYLEASRRHGFELIWTVWASAIPGGLIPRETFDWIEGKLLDGIKNAGEIDGVLLHLHGSAVVDGIPDAEGRVLEDVRKLVGPDIPIVSTLDLHSLNTQQMMDNATLLIGYDTYPHVDPDERATEVADNLMRIIRGAIKPTGALEKPPLWTPLQSQVTSRDDTPMRRLMDRAWEIEKDPKVISASCFAGFPFADVHHLGLSTMVYTDGDPDLARGYAEELSKLAWDMHNQWLVHPTPVDEAVKQAIEAPEGPVILADIADSGAGGTSGDATEVLREMLEQGARSGVVCSISDQEAIDEAVEAGVGATLTMKIGGKRDKFHGDPVEVTGKVKLIHDGEFVRKGPMMTGALQTVGKTVVLEIGGIGGIEVMLTEHRAHPNDLEYFRAFGIEPTDRKMLVLKSAAHYRAAFDPIAKLTIEVDAPGLTSPDFHRFDFKKIRRPMYPFDDMPLDAYPG